MGMGRGASFSSCGPIVCPFGRSVPHISAIRAFSVYFHRILRVLVWFGAGLRELANSGTVAKVGARGYTFFINAFV